MIRFLFLLVLFSGLAQGATIAIIDTGFDLDHDYLRPKILKKETDEEVIDFNGWDFFDNSHLKKPVIEDKSSLQDVLLYREIRARGHRQGLTVDEFEWFKNKTSDKSFMEKVKLFKKHSHGTIVAGIALREGENISIFPIRGLNTPNAVVALETAQVAEGSIPLRGKTPEEKFQDDIKQSIDRVTKKFTRICKFISQKKIEIVNASYGITYKNIMTKFRERHKEITGKEIDEAKLKSLVDDYFQSLYEKGARILGRHPNILFVFSAGNSGLDNDNFHHYPSRIKTPNSISVAALNGEFLATFSNYGLRHVDIGAPGVAIPSIVPKVYSQDGTDLYSLSSGTSMAAPYVSNLAAQIKNTNPNLKAFEIKKIILETGDSKEHLKLRLISGSMVDNKKALKAALLSKDMKLSEAISLSSSGLIPLEDQISIGSDRAVSPEEMEKRLLNSIPSIITPSEVEDEPTIIEDLPTKSSSSSQKNQVKVPQDNSLPLPSKDEGAQKEFSDQVPSSQTEEQSQKPSEAVPASSSQPQPLPPETQSQESVLSSPQS
jgi:subtilisin family serine protease